MAGLGFVRRSYCRADDLLSQTQDAEAVARLRACARVVARRLAEVRMGAGFTLPEAVRAYEAKFIERTLKDAGGSSTRAAERLGIGHQALSYILEHRQRGLLPARTPVVKRRRSIIKKK
jgi:transcriptional regulator with PAS, ATPase and Fis domain